MHELLIGAKQQNLDPDSVDFRLYNLKTLAGGGNVGNFHHALGIYQNKFYISAGTSNGLPSVAFYEYDPIANVATTLGALPQAICGHVVKVVGDYMYQLCGMIDNNRTYTNVVRRYHLVDRVWEVRTPCPVTLCWGDGCVIGTDIYMVGGGITPATVEAPSEMYLYKYDTVTDTWTKITLTGISPRIGNGVTALNGSIYILGGRYNRVYLKDLWKYMPGTGELVRLADHPDPHGARFMLHGMLDKLLGLGGQLVSDSPYRNAYQYYLDEDRWELIRTHATFAFCAVGRVNRKFYLIGGRQSTTNYEFSP